MLYALANESSTNPFKISSHAITNNKNTGNVIFTTAKHSKNLAQTNQATTTNTNTNTNTTTTDTTAISASNNYVRRLSMPSAYANAVAAPLTTPTPTTTTTTNPVSRIPQPIAQHLNTDANTSRKHSLNQFYENTNATDEDALQNKYEYVEFYDEEDEEEEAVDDEEQRVNGHEENEETRPLQPNENGDFEQRDEGEEEEEDYSQRNNTSLGYREPLLHLRN